MRLLILNTEMKVRAGKWVHKEDVGEDILVFE